MLKIFDDQGREVFLSQGIGGPKSAWGSYRREPSGSLSRIKSISLTDSRAEAKLLLYAYAEIHKGWHYDEAELRRLKTKP